MNSRKLTAVILLAALVAVEVPAATNGASASLPGGFFGVAPQTTLTPEDARYMKAGGIESVRYTLIWPSIQSTAKGGYDWGYFDEVVEVAARAGLRVLPVINSTPSWLAKKSTTLPVKNARQRAAWAAFLEAAVKRYGPGGEFWSQHAQVGVNYEPAIAKPLPIREWQIWNEANFFYFTYPVSPSAYAKLVTISSKAIKHANPGAKVILAGLFGEPTAKGKRGMPAATFLERLYAVPGLKSRFDGVALHPYAVDAETLEELVEGFHEVSAENHDRPLLYITEMGWGSQNDFNQVAFEQGIGGQVLQLRGAYGYLIDNQRRLNLKQVDWFSWKDLRGTCTFCDSVGFFREGARYKPKPAWQAFVALTGGRSRP
ncbi:MAG TPA: beta-galactosidase [Solirubrobacterales bacterium]|nr:beta-galactosidase [Solirubrobacterales bacterium]